MSPRAVRTPQEDALRSMTEAELQRQVIALARSLGWGTTRPARKELLEEAATYHVEAPPLDGLVFHPRYSLGSEPGWPDLTLIRARDRRLVFAELKSEKGQLHERQVEILDLLRHLETPTYLEHEPFMGHISVHVWRPSDLARGAIAEVLR